MRRVSKRCGLILTCFFSDYSSFICIYHIQQPYATSYIVYIAVYIHCIHVYNCIYYKSITTCVTLFVISMEIYVLVSFLIKNELNFLFKYSLITFVPYMHINTYIHTCVFSFKGHLKSYTIHITK